MPTVESEELSALHSATEVARPSLAAQTLKREGLFSYLRRAYSLDLRSLALFRIALALILLGDLVVRSFDLTVFYTDWGVLPRAALLGKFSPPDRFSIHLMSGQPVFEMGLFLLAAMFAVMLLLGIRTRFATIVSWFMLVSLQNRNLEILQGGDVYLRQLAFWAMFLPLGAVYSMDSALNTANSDETQTRNKNSYFSAPGIALMLQVAFVYVFSVLLKSGSAWRVEHSAVYYALNIQQMSTYAGQFLLHFPKLLPWLTREALAHETVIPILVLLPVFFGPIRTSGVLAILLLHFGLGTCIRLGPFPWIAGAAALPLLPTWFWEEVIPRSWRANIESAGLGLRLYYDERYSCFKKMAFALRTFLMIPCAEVVPFQDYAGKTRTQHDERGWMVTDLAGKRHYGFGALRCALAYSPFFGFLAPSDKRTVIGRIGDACCRWVHARRQILSKNTAWLKFAPRKPRTYWPVNVLAAFFILYVFLWNVSSVSRYAFVPSHEKLAITLGLDQRWDMFAPYPLTYDGWYVIEGRLRNGSEVNVLHPDRGVSFEQPASIADQYPNERWRKYLMNLSEPENADYRMFYGRFFCRSWNTGRSRNDPGALDSFDIFFMGHQNSIDRPPAGFSRDLLWHHECFK